MAQRVKNLFAMQETHVMQVLSLGWEDLLEKEMATHSSVLAWKIPWTEEPGGLQSMGSQRVRYDCAYMHTSILRNRNDMKKSYNFTESNTGRQLKRIPIFINRKMQYSILMY